MSSIAHTERAILWPQPTLTPRNLQRIEKYKVSQGENCLNLHSNLYWKWQKECYHETPSHRNSNFIISTVHQTTFSLLLSYISNLHEKWRHERRSLSLIYKSTSPRSAISKDCENLVKVVWFHRIITYHGTSTVLFLISNSGAECVWDIMSQARGLKTRKILVFMLMNNTLSWLSHPALRLVWIYREELRKK